MEQKDARKTIDITIVKHGRVWTDVEVHYNTGRSGKAKVKKEYVADKKPGENIQVTGYLKRESSGYGVKTELIILSDEEFCKRQEELHKKDIEKWIQYFRKNAEDGKYYRNAVDKLHELGCSDYDKEILQTQHELEVSKWWGYFLKSYDHGNGYIYERAIDELHKLGCNDYDEKIKECRETVIRAKEAAGIRNIVIPAYNGFAGKPDRGSLLMHKGVPYRVLSSYYNSSDGWTFGALNEEWYDVKVQDITNTEEGKRC